MPDDGDFELPNVSERLSQIADRLKKGEEVPRTTVRTLLQWFGASRRGFFIVQMIDEYLTSAGLKTVPYFNHTYLDGEIHFALDTPLSEHTPSPGTDETPQVVDGPEQPTDSAIRISRLAAANNTALVVVRPTDSLAEAVTKMLYNDYSQLPVMTNERDVKGLISWNSIGARLARGKKAERVAELMDSHHEIMNDASLFDAIPIITQHQYVLVRGPDRKITGILTGSDLSVQFRQLAEPFLLLGEIENHLRQIIRSAAFGRAELASAKNPSDSERTVSSVEDLTFGEYIRLLQMEANWTKVGLGVDRVSFCALLDDVRTIRNGVMHFDPDGVISEDLLKLRRLVTMLQRLGSIDGR